MKRLILERQCQYYVTKQDNKDRNKSTKGQRFILIIRRKRQELKDMKVFSKNIQHATEEAIFSRLLGEILQRNSIQ